MGACSQRYPASVDEALRLFTVGSSPQQRQGFVIRPGASLERSPPCDPCSQGPTVSHSSNNKLHSLSARHVRHGCTAAPEVLRDSSLEQNERPLFSFFSSLPFSEHFYGVLDNADWVFADLRLAGHLPRASVLHCRNHQPSLNSQLHGTARCSPTVTTPRPTTANQYSTNNPLYATEVQDTQQSCRSSLDTRQRLETASSGDAVARSAPSRCA